MMDVKELIMDENVIGCPWVEKVIVLSAVSLYIVYASAWWSDILHCKYFLF